MTETISGGDGKLGRVIEAWIEECADSMHFDSGDEGVPVAHGAPRPGPGVLVVAGKAECVRYHGGARHIRTGHYTVRYLLRVERLPVQKQFRIELARSPAAEHSAYGRHIDSKDVGHGLQIRRQRHDRADVQVVI